LKTLVAFFFFGFVRHARGCFNPPFFTCFLPSSAPKTFHRPCSSLFSTAFCLEPMHSDPMLIPRLPSNLQFPSLPGAFLLATLLVFCPRYGEEARVALFTLFFFQSPQRETLFSWGGYDSFDKTETSFSSSPPVRRFEVRLASDFLSSTPRPWAPSSESNLPPCRFSKPLDCVPSVDTRVVERPHKTSPNISC